MEVVKDMAKSLDALTAMVYRQVKRWISARSRVVSMILQPLLWIIFLGIGFGTIFSAENIKIPEIPGLEGNATIPLLASSREIIVKYFNNIFGGVDYITFLVTGMVAMTAFIGSFVSGISVIWDKQFGFLKESLVAPAPRSAIILGRMLGDAIVNTIQSLLIILLALVVAHSIKLAGIPFALLYVFIMSLGLTGVGVAISLKLSSIEGFQMIVNLITMPLIFMSGAFYPVDSMPGWMKIIALLNPLTYAVHGSRYWLVGITSSSRIFTPLNDLLVLIATAIVFALIAVKIFERTTLED